MCQVKCKNPHQKHHKRLNRINMSHDCITTSTQHKYMTHLMTYIVQIDITYTYIYMYSDKSQFHQRTASLPPRKSLRQHLNNVSYSLLNAVHMNHWVITWKTTFLHVNASWQTAPTGRRKVNTTSLVNRYRTFLTRAENLLIACTSQKWSTCISYHKSDTHRSSHMTANAAHWH